MTTYDYIMITYIWLLTMISHTFKVTENSNINIIIFIFNVFNSADGEMVVRSENRRHHLHFKYKTCILLRYPRPTHASPSTRH